jgi:hypothetical protein
VVKWGIEPMLLSMELGFAQCLAQAKDRLLDPTTKLLEKLTILDFMCVNSLHLTPFASI